MSNDQFVSFAASKALVSFIMYNYIVTDSQVYTTTVEYCIAGNMWWLGPIRLVRGVLVTNHKLLHPMGLK